MESERKKLLLVNGCINRGTSRTLRLARRVALHYPDHEIEELVLEEMHLAPLDSEYINRRNELAQKGRFDDSIFDLAHQFAEADVIIVASPFWENCFSSMIKIYMEHAAAVGVVFRYSETGMQIGMCRAKRLYYVTTRGGYVGDDEDHACWIYREISATYGIGDCRIVSASGLDIVGNDVEGIMEEAFSRADSAVLVD